MAALAQGRMRYQDAWKHKIFTLTSGTKAFKGGAALLVFGTGKVIPGVTSNTNAITIGVFDEDVDATLADTPVRVDLEREVLIEWFVNGTAGDAVAATDVGRFAYFMDDQTVSILHASAAGAGRTMAGRIWGIDSKRGVAIEKHYDPPTPTAVSQPLPAFVANDSAPTSVAIDATYTVPATAAASTVTLPAAALDGTRVRFIADGVANSFTVQYRDATGVVNLTTALTALKRHYVLAEKVAGKWFANAYVSP